MSAPRYDEIDAGYELPGLTTQLTRADLVRYAGASGDFNIIHWNERVAREVRLPNVIAHGMLTMAKGANLVTAWVGDPGRVEEYGVRFAKPVVVPTLFPQPAEHHVGPAELFETGLDLVGEERQHRQHHAEPRHGRQHLPEPAAASRLAHSRTPTLGT